jgi:hypothetical protein
VFFRFRPEQEYTYYLHSRHLQLFYLTVFLILCPEEEYTTFNLLQSYDLPHPLAFVLKCHEFTFLCLLTHGSLWLKRKVYIHCLDESSTSDHKCHFLACDLTLSIIQSKVPLLSYPNHNYRRSHAVLLSPVRLHLLLRYTSKLNS